MKIFISIPDNAIRDTFLPKDVMEYVHTLGEVTLNETGHNLTSEEVASYLKDMDVIITGWGAPNLNATALAQADKLKCVIHTGGSVASLVTPELYARGIRVLSGNLMYAQSVAEGVIAYALTALRAIPYYTDEVKKGGWQGERGFRSKGLLDAKVNLVGLGAIPSFLVPMLKAFNCTVRAYDKYASDAKFEALGVERLPNLEDAFTGCDILSLHLPITEETRGCITRELLERIPDGTLLINTARGGILDEEALADVLSEGRFEAVLDVYTHEPLPADSPLCKLPNVLLMPHMAGPTLDRRPRITRKLLDEFLHLDERASDFEIDWEYARRMTKE